MPGSSLKGQVVQLDESSKLRFSESGREIERKDFPVVYFMPTLTHIGTTLALILAGFVITALVARIGSGGDDPA